MKKHIITEKEYNIAKEASKRNKNKRVDKRPTISQELKRNRAFGGYTVIGK